MNPAYYFVSFNLILALAGGVLIFRHGFPEFPDRDNEIYIVGRYSEQRNNTYAKAGLLLMITAFALLLGSLLFFV